MELTFSRVAGVEDQTDYHTESKNSFKIRQHDWSSRNEVTVVWNNEITNIFLELQNSSLL